MRPNACPTRRTRVWKQLPEVHRARHGVLRARLERISDGVGPAVRQEDDHRGTGEARGGCEVAHRLRQPGLLRGDGEDEKIGRLRLRPIGTGRRIGGFGDLEAAPDQESLEPIRPGAGVADEEDAVLGVFRQQSLPRDDGCQAIVHPMGRQPRSAAGAPGA